MIEENETHILITGNHTFNIPYHFHNLNIRIREGTIIEKGTRIFENTVIRENVFIGENNIIGNSCLIRNDVWIGNNNKIGFCCSLEPHATMGDNNSTQGFCMLSEYSLIGNNNFFGPHFNSMGDNTIGKPKGVYKPNPAKIENNCRFGSGTRLVPGITISDNTITGAMSLVTHNTDSNSLYYGVPATKIKNINKDGELK